MTGGASDLALLGRVMGGLIVVIVLIGLIAKVARQTRGHNGTSGLRVIDRVGLSREANLAVVEVSNRMLLLGVTAQGVTMLANLDQADHEPAAAHDVQNSEPEPHDETFDEEAYFGEIGDVDPGTVDLYDIDPDQTGRYDTAPDAVSSDGYDQQYDAYPDPLTGSAQLDLAQIEQLGLDVSDTVDGLTVIRTRPAEWVEPAEPAQPIPAEIALDDYPDLASALRAAGRTADPAPADPADPVTSWAQAEALAEIPEDDDPDTYPANSYLDAFDDPDDLDLDDEDDEDAEYDEPAAPRTRAEARARQQPTGRSWIPLPRSRSVLSTADPVEVEAPAEPARIKVPPTPRPKKARRVVVSSTTQASGSVLSPNTWRQGLEALRELTVRRG